MPTEIAVLLIIFTMPLIALSMILAYRLLNQFILARQGKPVTNSKKREYYSEENLESLRTHAAEMQRRLGVLEEIIRDEPPAGGAS